MQGELGKEREGVPQITIAGEGIKTEDNETLTRRFSDLFEALPLGLML